jgi:hypothetical protein
MEAAVMRHVPVGAVPPIPEPPLVLYVCTDEGRHDRTEVLRLWLITLADGSPGIVAALSRQPGPDSPMSRVDGAERAQDGHETMSRRCSLCERHLERNADKLAPKLGQIAAAGARVTVDISRPEVDLL